MTTKQMIKEDIYDILEDKEKVSELDVKRGSWEQCCTKVIDLIADFTTTYFKYNEYSGGYYNNNELVSHLYHTYYKMHDGVKLEMLSFDIHIIAASLIDTCYPLLDVNNYRGVEDDIDITNLISMELIYQYLTWCFSNSRSNVIDWSLFNKKTVL